MKMVPITPELEEELEIMLDEDGFRCPDPTHVFLDNKGELTAACSIRYAPLVLFWMNSARRRPLAGFRIYMLMENCIRGLGHDTMLLPMHPDSPWHKWLETAQYSWLDSCQIFKKELK